MLTEEQQNVLRKACAVLNGTGHYEESGVIAGLLASAAPADGHEAVDERAQRHVNDKTKHDAACEFALSERGAQQGQGVDPYWAWGFRTGWTEARAALATAPTKDDDVRERIARALHYPACWDTAAYPTLESAAWEAIACAKLGCSTCEATAPTMSEAVRDVHGAQALLHDAACECMSPEQMDKYEALFVGADDLPLRFLRCVLKRIDRANAEGEKT